MRLVGEYHLPPGKCFFTGSSNNDEGVVDFDHDIDFYGRVYMRMALAEELAGMIGWHSPAEFDDLERERDLIASELEALRDTFDALRELADAQAKVDDLAASLAS